MIEPLVTGGIWEVAFYGSSVYDYATALVIFALLAGAFKATQWLALKSVKNVTSRTRTEFDDALVKVVEIIKPPFYIFLAFYIALQYLHLTGPAEKVMDGVLLIWVVYQVIVALRIILGVYVEHRVATQDDPKSQSVAQVINSLANVVLWILGILFVLQNLGVNVTSLVAGLGIGGVAVALAAQNVLGDLFNSLAIYFDKPFVPGDFITFAGKAGTVQQVGVKTTRIKALHGEEIVVPNSELANTQVHNYGRMQERRVVFEFGITYETPTDKMREIPGMVARVINEQSDARFDRCHFKEFADSALVYETVYHAETKEYGPYMDMNEQILLKIKDTFEEAGINMAYPTRTVYMQKS